MEYLSGEAKGGILSYFQETLPIAGVYIIYFPFTYFVFSLHLSGFLIESFIFPEIARHSGRNLSNF
jgi:hypothetical protein